MQCRLKVHVVGWGLGLVVGNAGTSEETRLMVTYHTGEFVQTALLLADSFLRMKEKSREKQKTNY